MIPLPYNKINHCLKAQLSPMQMSFVWGSLNQIKPTFIFVLLYKSICEHISFHLKLLKVCIDTLIASKWEKEVQYSPSSSLHFAFICFFICLTGSNSYLLTVSVCRLELSTCSAGFIRAEITSRAVVQCGTFRLSQLKMRYFYSKLLRLSKFNKNCTQKHSNHHASQETRPLLFSVINSAGQQLWRMCNCCYDVLKSNCAVSQWLGISEVN